MPILLNCDNLFAVYMATDSIFHSRTKYIALDYYFVRERVASGTHQVKFITSSHQLADIFTKGLPIDQFECLVSKLVSSPKPSLQGSVEELPHY